MLSIEDALARILDGVAPLAAERVPLLDGLDRVLAEPLAARLTQPPFPASAMDGYAVRAADVAALPAQLSVIGEAAAGHGFSGAVGPGQAVRIFTGAPVPPGTDAIVIQENTVIQESPAGDGRTVIVREGTPDAEHVRPKGFDFAAGQALLAAGVRLDARLVTLAAAMGWPDLPVRRKPKVAILATGDELVMPGVAPGPDQIVCSNPFGIAAMVARAGGAPVLLGIARDTPQDLGAKVAEAGDADILVTIGGASVGDHDLVAPVLQSRGMKLDFWKIAMRPGKPLMFGRLGASRVLGLPGNPVSSLICARVFLVPLIARLLGRGEETALPVRAVLSTALEANGPRQHYMRAILEPAPQGGLQVRPVRSQDSSLLSPLADASALIVRPPRAPALMAGTPIDVLPLDF